MAVATATWQVWSLETNEGAASLLHKWNRPSATIMSQEINNNPACLLDRLKRVHHLKLLVLTLQSVY